MDFSIFHNVIIKIIDRVKIIYSCLIDFLFPIECLKCGKENEWICDECFKHLSIHANQYCMSCKCANFFGEYCENCQDNYFLAGVSIAGDYENLFLANLIRIYKYNFVKDLGEVFGKILIIFFKRLKHDCGIFLNDPDRLNRIGQKYLRTLKTIFASDDSELIIMPVPLSKKRLRWRGYNQAEIISRFLADHFKIIFDDHSLKRIKFFQPQVKLSENQRLYNTINNFRCDDEEFVRGKNILLVDDIITTGATLNECARVLKENGAKIVWGLVVAKG
jgi:competence protein ComFC